MNLIDKVGLLVARSGRVLLCRKRRGTTLLILPGGKREAGESSEECLRREIREELGGAEVRGIERIGEYTTEAADPGKTIRIELYHGELEREPQASGEIAELVWFGPEDDWARLAPSLRDLSLPDLMARGVLGWSVQNEG